MDCSGWVNLHVDCTLLTRLQVLRSPKRLDIGGRCRGGQQMGIKVYTWNWVNCKANWGLTPSNLFPVWGKELWLVHLCSSHTKVPAASEPWWVTKNSLTNCQACLKTKLWSPCEREEESDGENTCSYMYWQGFYSNRASSVSRIIKCTAVTIESDRARRWLRCTTGLSDSTLVVLILFWDVPHGTECTHGCGLYHCMCVNLKVAGKWFRN